MDVYTTNNRFEIIRIYDLLQKKCRKKKPHKILSSENNLIRSLQKHLYKNFDITNSYFEKKEMVTDIQNIFYKTFGSKVIIKNNRKYLDEIIFPLIYNRSFNTNDNSILSKKIINNKNIVYDYKLINVEKEYNLDNCKEVIYYIPNLDRVKKNIILDLIKNKNSFIIDIKNKYHKLNQIRVVNINGVNIENDDIDLYNIFNTWLLLIYGNFDGLISEYI